MRFALPFWKKDNSPRSSRVRPSRRRERRPFNLERSLHVEPLEERALLAVLHWTGDGSNNNWSTAANWQDEQQQPAVPATGDQLIFAGTTRTTTQNDITALTSFQSIEFANSNFSVAGNALTLTGSVTVDSGVTGSSIAANVALSGDIGFVLTNSGLTVSGVISGSGKLVKSGSGTLIVTADNSYTGGTTISAGTIQVANNTTTGSLGTGPVANSGAVIVNRAYSIVMPNVFSGTGSLTQAGTGVLWLSGDSPNYSGTITVNSGRSFLVGTGGTSGSYGTATVNLAGGLAFNRSDDLTVSGKISGAGRIVQNGTGTITLGATNNTYTGETKINSGTVAFVSGGLYNGTGKGPVNMAGSGTLRWSGTNSLDISSRLALSNGINATFDVGANNVTFADAVGSSSSAAITKTGSGTLTLSGNNTYTGSTTVSQGELKVNGSLAGSGAVTVASGAMLSGSGTVGAVNNSGTLAPGTSGSGTLSTGDLTFNAGSNYTVALPVSGVNKTSVTGGVTLGGATLNVTSTRVAQDGAVMVLIQNDGTDAVSGTFANLAEGTPVTVNGVPYVISYVYNAETGQLATGNDVALIARLAGTAGNDQIELQLRASAQYHQWRINSGTWQQVAVTGNDRLLIDGGGGTDTLVITSTTDDDLASLRKYTGSLQNTSGSYALAWSGITTARVTGNGGSDTADLYDSPEVDAFNTTPTSAQMRSPSTGTAVFDNTALGFRYVRGHSAAGEDTANLNDSSGNDLFSFYEDYQSSGQSYGRLSRTDSGAIVYQCEASGFRYVHALGGNGGNDRADLFGSSANDTFQAQVTYGRIYNTTAFGRALYFEEVHADGGGGSDTAAFWGSDANDDFLLDYDAGVRTSSMHRNVASGSCQFSYGTGFETIAVLANVFNVTTPDASDDTVTLHDGTGNDVFGNTSTGVTLVGSGVSLTASYFETVEAIAEYGGTDTATLQDTTGNDLLVTSFDTSGALPQVVTELTVGGYQVTSRGFAQTTANSLQGYDVARFSQSATPASDSVTSTPDWTRYTYPNGSWAQVNGYERAWVYSDLAAQFTDLALLEAIRHALGLQPTDAVTATALSQLTSLSLDSTKITSLEGLDLATNLQTLTMIPSDLAQTTELPSLSPLAGLTSLHTLTLEGLGLEDTELSPLGSLTQLETLDLAYNHLAADAIPASFSDLTALESLDLRYNQIDVIPTTIANLSSLTSLAVHGNVLTDTPRTGLANLAGKLISVDVAPDHPERATTIADLAAALYKLPIEMYEYVVNTIEFTPYNGAMKGAEATLQTKEGNDWDTASLLAGLFAQAGISVQYVTGQIEVPTNAYAADGRGAEDYVGVFTAAAAEQVLDAANLNATVVNDATTGQPRALRFDHAWLTASVTVPGQGTQTVTLDPAWKFRDFQPGLQGLLEEVPFDSEGYLSEYRKEYAYEYYQQQVRDYLAASHPDLTIADVAYDGPLHTQVITSLQSPVGYASYGTPTTYSAIPDAKMHHVRVKLTYYNALNQYTYTCFDWTDALPEISQQPLTIFSRSGQYGNVIPELFLGSSCVASTSVVIWFWTSNVRLQVDHSEPGGQTESYLCEYNVGSPLTIGFNAGQVSDTSIHGTRTTINEQALHTRNEETVDYVAKIGSLLNLGLQRFFQEQDRSTDAVASLGGAVNVHKVTFGVALASGGYRDPNFSLQVPYIPTDPMKIGIRLGTVSMVPIDGDQTTRVRDRILGYTASSLTAGVWEEITNIPSVSTIKSLQLAYQDNVPVASIDTSNQGQLGTLLTFPSPQYDTLESSVITSINSFVNRTDSSFKYRVTVPTQVTTIGVSPTASENWVGVGYIVERAAQGTDDWTNVAFCTLGITGGQQVDLEQEGNTVAPVSQSTVKPCAVEEFDPNVFMTSVHASIGTGNGNVTQDAADIEIPNLGFPLSFRRHYDSYNTVADGEDVWSDRGMGEGWSFTYSDSLTDSDIEADPDGTKIWFTDSGVRLKFEPNGTGGYTTPEGVYGSLVFDAENEKHLWTDKTGNVVQFDASGKLLSMVDRYGNGVRLEYYTGTNQIHFVYDACDTTNTRKLTFTYISGSLATIADFTGRTWTYGYDGSGRLTSVTAPSDSQTAAAVTEYEYYTDNARRGLLKKVTNANDEETDYTYYANRRGFTITDAENGTTSFSYDLYRYRTAVTDQRGQTTYYDHDDNGNRIQSLYPDQTATQYTWNKGLQTSETDAYGQMEKWWYDTKGNVVLHEDAEGTSTVTKYTADTKNNVEWVIEVGPHPTATAIDFSSATFSNYGTGGTTPNNYQVLDDGATLKLWGDAWKAIPISYTVTANTVLEFDFTSTAQGNGSRIGLDADLGTSWTSQLMLYGTSPAGHTHFCDYAETAPLTRHYVIPMNQIPYILGTISYLTFMNADTDVSTPSESIFSNVKLYEAPGNVVVNRNIYNSDGTLWKAINPVGAVTSYAYPTSGSRGLPSSMTLPRGLGGTDTTDYTTNYTYNDAGQVTEASSRVATNQWITVSHTYDDRGNLTSTTDGNGNVSEYTYDLLGRQLTVTLPDPDGTGSLAAPTQTSTYDALGELLSVTDGTGRTSTIAYDALGRPIRATNVDGTYRLNRYDQMGNLVSQTDEAGHVTSYTYDDRNRLVATILPDGSVLRTRYDGGGRLVQSTDALGNVTTYRYDKLGRKVQDILSYPSLATAVNVDDGATGFATTRGTWTTVSGSGGQEGDYCYAGTDSTATWTFAGLRDDVIYEIFVTWLADAQNTNAAPFAVFDGSVTGTLRGTVNIDQKKVPGHDPALGNGWRSLGRFQASSGTITVQLTGVSTGRVQADGVLLAEAPAITSYGYDSHGNLQYVTDTLGTDLGDPNHTVEYQYDLAGRKTDEILPSPDGSAARPTTHYTYDTNNNVQTVTDARGAATNYTYDEMNRLKTAVLPDPDGASGPLGTATIRYFYDANGNLRYVVDPRGTDAKEAAYTTEYQYDALNRKTREIANDPDGPTNPLLRPETVFTYDARGNVASVTDARGNTTSYLYDARDRQTVVTDALGAYAGDAAHSSFTTYDALGNVLSVTDPLGRSTSYEYDKANRLVRVVLPRPNATDSAPVTSYAYDAAGNLVSTTDPLGTTTWYQYDGLNRCVLVTDALGYRSGDPAHSTRTQFDSLGNVVAVTDPLGRVIDYEYDNLGRLTAEMLPSITVDGGQSVRPTTSYAYDANGNLTSVTDPLNHVTCYQYDALNRQTCVTDALGASVGETAHSVFTVYDVVGNVSESRDQLGRVTSYQYDNLSRLIRTTEPDPDGGGTLTRPETDYAYDAVGNLISTTDPLEHTTWFKYDALNRQVRTVDALGTSVDDLDHATVTVYDAIGRVYSVTDPEGNVTTYAYDGLDRVVKETTAEGSRLYQYNLAGDLVEATDRNGRVTRWSYDPLGQMVEEQWLNGSGTTIHTIHQWYDAAGQLRGITETDTASTAAATNYQYDYNAAGDVTRVRMAPGDVTQPTATTTNGTLATGDTLLDWDSDGVQERVDAYQRTTWTAGDVVLLKVSSTAFDPILIVEGPGGSSSSWIIDSNGGGGTTACLLINVTTTGTWTIRVTSPEVDSGTYTLEETPFRNALAEFTYSYDAAGNVQTTNDGRNALTEYDYDALNRLSQLRQSGTGVASKRANFTYGNDSRANTTTSYADLAGTQQVVTSTYGYDGMGRINDLVQRHGATTIADYGWTYDAASRITGMTSGDGTSTLGYDDTDQLTSADHSYQANESYDYDANGNRELANGVSYTTGADNRVSSDGVYNYSYDAEGNRIQRTKISDGTTTRYTWDQRNRLVQVTEHPNATPGTPATRILKYFYDSADRLVRRTLDTNVDGTPETVAKYVYDGGDLALELNGSDALTHRYLWNTALDQVLADEKIGDQVIWPLADYEGTVRDLVSSSGTVLNHRKFDSFGRVTSETNAAVDCLFGYTGQILDEATGLQNHLERWYDPALGRWLSEDPLGFAAGDANLSRYCGNSPTNYVDPTGLEWGDGGGFGMSLFDDWSMPLFDDWGLDWGSDDGFGGWTFSFDFGWGDLDTGWGSLDFGPDGFGCGNGPLAQAVDTGWGDLSGMALATPEFRVSLSGSGGGGAAFGTGMGTGGGGAAGGLASSARASAIEAQMQLRVPDFELALGPTLPVAAAAPPEASGGNGSGIGFWDWVQGGLDVAGTFEPTPFCDLASATISAFRGNWGDAGLSLAGTIPYIGDLGKVAKYGSKVAKVANAADNVADATRLVDKANDLRKAEHLVPNKGPYRGGAHGDISGPKVRGDGLDSHHMPDRHANPPVHPNDAPAIQMDPPDHWATSSNGRNGVAGAQYRAQTADMIRNGRYRDAMAREIRDVRRAAQEASGDARKYDSAIQEMLEYARRTGQLPGKR